MRLHVMVAGVLVLTAGTAVGGYLVELEGGDRMTVDSYWQDGDRMHLMRDGVDLSVARSRIRSVRETADDPPSAPAPRARVAEETEGQPVNPPSRADLEAKQAGIERHLLQVQQERFEATARGESPETLKKLGNEFQRTQQRRQDVMHELERLNGTK